MSFVLPTTTTGTAPDARRRSVLLIDGDSGQSRSALAAVRALAHASYRVAVATPARFSMAAASRSCSERIPIPDSARPDHADAVRAELEARPYLAALPSSDASLRALHVSGRQFLDKHDLAHRAAVAGLPHLGDEMFATVEALLGAADGLDYPCVFKPDAASTPAGRADAPADLLVLEDIDGRVIVQPYVDAPMTAVGGLVWNGELVLAVHQRYLRTWPTPCGTASAAVTTEPDETVEHGLLALLDGYQGLFQAQFVGPYLIDLNPRVYGSLPLATAAGVNLPASLCRLISGQHVPAARGKAGVRYRWLEGDLRHLAHHVRSGTISPLRFAQAVAPRRGTAHSVTMLRDPAPLVSRIRHVVAPTARK